MLPWAHLHYLPRGFLAEDHGQWRRVEPSAEVGVDVIDTDEIILDEDLALFEAWDGEVGAVFEDIGSAGFGDTDTFHCFRERCHREGSRGGEAWVEGWGEMRAEG